MSMTDEELAVLQAQTKQAMRLYRRKTELIEARRVTEKPEWTATGLAGIGDYILSDGRLEHQGVFDNTYEPLLPPWWEDLWEIWQDMIQNLGWVTGPKLGTDGGYIFDQFNLRLYGMRDTDNVAVDWWCEKAEPWEQVHAVAMLLHLEAIPPEEREVAIRKGEIFV